MKRVTGAELDRSAAVKHPYRALPKDAYLDERPG